MGLDWVLQRRKPKPGAKKEFDRLTRELRALDEAPRASARKRRQLDARLDAISTRAEEAIGAPRVGIDEEATLWWRKHVYAPNLERALLGASEPEEIARWSLPIEKLLRADRGKFVCELAKVQGGRSEAGGWSLVADIDYSGVGVLGEPWFEFLGELQAEAWVDHSAAEAASYARRLEKATRKAIAAGEVAAEGIEQKTVRAAIAWLEFWSGRGFGFHAWS